MARDSRVQVPVGPRPLEYCQLLDGSDILCAEGLLQDTYRDRATFTLSGTSLAVVLSADFALVTANVCVCVCCVCFVCFFFFYCVFVLFCFFCVFVFVLGVFVYFPHGLNRLSSEYPCSLLHISALPRDATLSRVLFSALKKKII